MTLIMASGRDRTAGPSHQSRCPDGSAFFTGTTDNLFENRGTVRKLPGTGTSTLNVNNPVRNSGLFDVGTETVSTTSGGFEQTDGELRIQGGQLNATGRLVDVQGGVVIGVGTIRASTVNNAATVPPGGAEAAGTLTITGAYTQTAAGVLNIELGGTAAGEYGSVVGDFAVKNGLIQNGVTLLPQINARDMTLVAP